MSRLLPRAGNQKDHITLLTPSAARGEMTPPAVPCTHTEVQSRNQNLLRVVRPDKATLQQDELQQKRITALHMLK